MANSIKLTNTAITGAGGLKLLNSTFTYAWKNNTSEDPAESSYGNVESIFQGWENPQINLKFYLPIDNATYTDGTTWLNWAKWNQLAKNLYDGTAATQTTLTIVVGGEIADGIDETYNLPSLATTEATTVRKGITLEVVTDCFLKSINKSSTCTATVAYLLDFNNNVISRSNFSSNTATFSYSKKLRTGYKIVLGKETNDGTSIDYYTSYTSTKKTSALSFPYIGNHVKITGDQDNATTGLYNIERIVTQAVVETTFSDYSADSTTTAITAIPVVIKSYNLSFSPDESNKSGFWTISAQLSVTK